MAKEIILKFGIEGIKTVGELKDTIKDLKKEIDKEPIGTDKFKELTINISDAEEELKKFKTSISALSSGALLKGLASIATTAEGIFTVAENALDSFGLKHSAVTQSLASAEKTITNLLSLHTIAINIQNAVKLISIAQSRLYLVGLALEGAMESKNIIIKGAATIAMRILNATMKANPILLLVGLLITLGTALAAFTNRTDEAAEAQAKLNLAKEDAAKKEEIYNQVFQKYADKTDAQRNRELELLKAKGATEDMILNKEIQRREEAITWINAQGKALGYLSDKQKEELANLNNEIAVLQEKNKTDQREKDKKHNEDVEKETKSAYDKLKSLLQKHKDDLLDIEGKSAEEQLQIERDKSKKELQEIYNKTNKGTEATRAYKEALLTIDKEYEDKSFDAFYDNLTKEQEAEQDAEDRRKDREKQTRQTKIDNQNEVNQYIDEQNRTYFDNKLTEIDRQEADLVTKEGLTEDEKTEIHKIASDKRKQLATDEVNFQLETSAQAFGQAATLFKKGSQEYKVFALSEALISTYLGATKALATLPPPSSFITAAVTIATGLANVQKINATKAARGIHLNDSSLPGSSTSDSIPAYLSKGEAVINANSTQMFLPLLSEINAAGGGVRFNTGGLVRNFSSNRYATGGLVSTSTLNDSSLAVMQTLDRLNNTIETKLTKPMKVFTQVGEISSEQTLEKTIESRASF
jgi:hypothetical protein